MQHFVTLPCLRAASGRQASCVLFFRGRFSFGKCPVGLSRDDLFDLGQTLETPKAIEEPKSKNESICGAEPPGDLQAAAGKRGQEPGKNYLGGEGGLRVNRPK